MVQAAWHRLAQQVSKPALLQTDWIRAAIRPSNPFPYPVGIPGGIQRSVDRDGDVNGGADGQEYQGGKAEGSESLIGFDTLSFGVPNGKAGKVGAKVRGRDQRLGSEQSRHHLIDLHLLLCLFGTRN